MLVVILFECMYRMFYDSVRSLPANLSFSQRNDLLALVKADA